VLLGEHGTDQAEKGVAVGKDADQVGAPADLAVEPLGGIVRPDLPPDFLRECERFMRAAQNRSALRANYSCG